MQTAAGDTEVATPYLLRHSRGHLAGWERHAYQNHAFQNRLISAAKPTSRSGDYDPTESHGFQKIGNHAFQNRQYCGYKQI